MVRFLKPFLSAARVCLFLTFLFAIETAAAQSPVQSQGEPAVQWAVRVVKASSQLYRRGPHSAYQLLGKPNSLSFLPYTGIANPCAWMADNRTDGLEPDLDTNARAVLRVGFEQAVSARQVFVLENLNPGAISTVRIIGVNGEQQTVYSAAAGQIPFRYRFLNVFFDPPEFKVKQVELEVETGKVPGWNSIDAIALGTTADSIKPEINLPDVAEFGDEKPENLGSLVNSEFPELLPVISADGRTLYFCRRGHPDNLGDEKRDDIWFSHRTSGFWSEAERMDAPLNNDYSNFLCSMMPDGNTIYVGNVYRPDSEPMPGVSVSYRTADGWSYPQRLEIDNFHNRGRNVLYQVGNDGKTLLMALERNESYGGMDIYVSRKQEDETWTEPVNLGGTVNTAADETTVFLASDNRTIYFSSSGHNGYGLNDVFMSRRLDDTWTNWTEPVNLGPNINTVGWDGNFSIPASGQYAYFVSSLNTYGKEDIFRVKLPQSIRPRPVVLVSGTVRDTRNGQAIAARIIYEDLATGEIVGEAYGDPSTGEYQIALPEGTVYAFRAQAPNYFAVNQNLDLAELADYDELTRDLELTPIERGQTVRLNNIFFDTGTSALKTSSFPELMRVVELLQNNPNMTITVRGHTDNVGESGDNMELSRSRAGAVVEYLVSQGIAANRMKQEGFGEDKPVSANDTAEGRELNRRVEFHIDSE